MSQCESMLEKLFEEAIYLSPLAETPAYLQKIVGLKLIKCSNVEELQHTMQEKPDIKLFVVHCDGLSLKAVESLKKIPHQLPHAKVLVIAGNNCKHLGSTQAGSSLVMLSPLQAPEIRGILSRFVQGQAFKIRRFERQALNAPVMIKRSSYSSEAPIHSQVDLLMEAQMVDFSKGGAQVMMEGRQIDRKDLVSLLYQNQMGQWTTIETQVRWVSKSADGRMSLGLQFVALAS